MTIIYAVYSLTENRVVYCTFDRKQAQSYVVRQLERDIWPMKRGVYYCPFEIHDTYVHPVECDCEKCTGVKRDNDNDLY